MVVRAAWSFCLAVPGTDVPLGLFAEYLYQGCCQTLRNYTKMIVNFVQKWASGLPYLRISTVEKDKMHLILKHFGFLIEWRYRN